MQPDTGEALSMPFDPPLAQTTVKGYALLSGWGVGLESLPAEAALVAQGRRFLPITPPVHVDERLRRATRECVLAVATVERALAASTLASQSLAGERTALVYATASAYAATNWSFVRHAEQAGYFPYTAPSAVPGEVTIHFGITGPYHICLSGANAGIEALWYAAMLLATGQCEQAVVLGVEMFTGCEDLYARSRWLLGTPLVEAVACLILERQDVLAEVGYRAGHSDDGLSLVAVLPHMAQETSTAYLCLPTLQTNRALAARLSARWPQLSIVVPSERLGMCLACTPLISLMLSVAAGRQEDVLCISRWWDTWSVLRWPHG